MLGYDFLCSFQFSSMNLQFSGELVHFRRTRFFISLLHKLLVCFIPKTTTIFIFPSRIVFNSAWLPSFLGWYLCPLGLLLPFPLFFFTRLSLVFSPLQVNLGLLFSALDPKQVTSKELPTLMALSRSWGISFYKCRVKGFKPICVAF